MDSYTSLLEKTRVAQPSFQKFAVISIFSKLRTAPVHLGPDSIPGTQAISQCLQSSSPAVVDQSVRELCRLVLDFKLDLSRALVDLQSALEGSDPKFASIFVKSLGFLVRIGFERSNGSWKPESHEDHPFIKILSSRREVESELVNQILLFMAKNKGLGMVKVCEFLRPFLNFLIIRIPFSDSSLFLFVRQLISSMASFCCSICNEAMPIFRLLINCLKFFPLKSLEETRNFSYVAECVVDSFVVVLRQLVGKGLQLITEAQLYGVELIENVLSLHTSPYKQSGGTEPIVELLKHMLAAQKDLALQYIPELSSVILSLSVLLIESELEHEQLSILKFLHFLLKWKGETEYVVDGAEYLLSEELLVIFPIINLISSPSKSVKGAANDLLVLLERLLVKLLTTPKIELAKKRGYPSISRPELIAYRLLQHLWFQDQFSLSSSFFICFTSVRETDVEELHGGPRSWAYHLKELALWIVERRKSGLPVPRSHEIFLTEMPLLLGAIASVLVMHPSHGSAAIDALASIGIMDPKLGVPLLLAILFYNNIFTRKDVVYQNMVPKLLGMLPSLASQSGMIPLVVQTFLPMLRKDAKPVLYATATRLLCQTWEINDRAFGSLQGVLLPKGFIEFMSERNICISMAISIRDVCRKNPDRGVDLILSVSACIESPDPTIQALGFQSLSYLCEADVIDFYTAWDVIAKYVEGYHEDPVLAYSVCLLLRWGAMDADAYPEASREVLKIVWGVGCSLQIGHNLQWAKAKASAFEALTKYEIPSSVNNISNFKHMVMDLLLSETNPDVLKALEGLQIKIIGHEHSNRQRFVKEKKVPASKIEKLLDVFPRVIFSSGKVSNDGELPGAALLSGSFTSNNLRSQGTARGLQDSHSGYEDMMVQIAASLQLSRNIFVALLSLQSWKAFVRRWMRANILSIDAKVLVIVSDKTSKAASDILKSMMRVAEESIPRSAENIALAIGALCAVLPPSAHTIKSTASKFLLGWLFQYEHEHCQWSAAMSLGLVSSSLHVTDHKQKFQNISGLLEVLCCSKSCLVKGACGIGLGFSCQDLLSRVEATDDSNANEENPKMQEERLLGGMFGVVNALGAGAGNLVDFHPLNSSVHTGYDQKEHSYISGPILANPVCEEHSTSLMQEIFLIAQNSDNQQLEQNAAWAVSFLRYQLWSREILNSANGTQTESVGSKSVSQGVPEDSAVMKLGLWLKSFNHTVTGTSMHICTVATILRCLSLAPRLPTLDWGAIVRRCMRYEAQVTGLLASDIACKEGSLREECLQFALVHAKQFDTLLTFLDELSDLSRFRTLELNLQSCLLSHLADLIKLFSGSRLEKLLDDVSNYLSSVTSDQVHDSEQKSSLRISCWKGLYQCLDEASLDTVEYIKNIERCMEMLFSLLPTPQSPAFMEVNQLNSVEWSEAVRCLAKGRQGWLLDFLQVSHLHSVQRDIQFVEVLRKIQAKAKLVRIGSIPLIELGKIKSYLLNSESLGTWGVLLEVVATLQHSEGNVKRQWLVDAVEISCVSSYPTTALQFLGLLSGSCCKYMPLLILDRSSVLNDLPVTLTSLLSDPNWEVIAETFTSYLLTSTERIYSWAIKLSSGDDTPSSQPIDDSENDMAPILLRVMHHTCVSLKDYLPLEKQLRLANMLLVI
ncbi:protein RST1 isoform X8 [Durio zibethinus]|uniref:Protein RST1 isoform X8 n=1 Tax=Durio zibethinus TaxID=66656 RepID=A0A6P5ZDX1_DURZI|nr:protein RST1 isoform X8 [Durio zibethinus]